MLKADDTNADADLIALNGLMHLLSSLKLTRNMSTIPVRRHCFSVWQPTRQIQGWTPDIKDNAAVASAGFAIRQRFLIQSPNPKRSFQCAIPMKQIFGFMDDYTKVTYGMRDTLQLIRKDDNDAMFRTNCAGAEKVVLSKLAWVVPIVQPKGVLKLNLYKSIAANNTIPVGMRLRQFETFTLPQARSTVWRLGVCSAPEKPRWVLVGLLTGKSGNQERNAANFYHCNLTSMQV